MASPLFGTPHTRPTLLVEGTQRKMFKLKQTARRLMSQLPQQLKRQEKTSKSHHMTPTPHFFGAVSALWGDTTLEGTQLGVLKNTLRLM